MTNTDLGMRSLRGLWVGDCIGNMGQLYNVFDILKALEKGIQQYAGILPLNQFQSSDDTEEAIVLYNHIVSQGDKFHPNEPIDLDKLAMEFAVRYMDRDPDGENFGYGLMTRKVLRSIYEGVPWAEANKTYRIQEGTSSHVDDLVTSIIDKKSWKEVAKNVGDKLQKEKTEPKNEVKIGSCGNGAAMRVAPLGALLKDYTAYEVARAASLAALPTHDHPEGIAGSMAVAAAAWILAKGVTGKDDFLNHVVSVTPQGEVERGIQKAIRLPFDAPLGLAIQMLGNGMHVTCQDTVPVCIWMVARALEKKQTYQELITDTAALGGDVDTTCAIVGGIYGVISDPSAEWMDLCLPMEGVIE